MKINSGGESAILLLNVIEMLDHCVIPYAVVGAFAASFYGQVRASIDADALIFIDSNNPKHKDLLNALKDSGLKVTIREGGPSDPLRGVIQIEDHFNNRVDLLLGIKKMPEGAYNRSVTASFMYRDIKIIGLEDFIAMKIYAGSRKDIEDVKGVLQVSRNRFDLPLIKQLTAQYGKPELERLEKILKELKI